MAMIVLKASSIKSPSHILSRGGKWSLYYNRGEERCAWYAKGGEKKKLTRRSMQAIHASERRWVGCGYFVTSMSCCRRCWVDKSVLHTCTCLGLLMFLPRYLSWHCRAELQRVSRALVSFTTRANLPSLYHCDNIPTYCHGRYRENC
jgi:hypothetical protein